MRISKGINHDSKVVEVELLSNVIATKEKTKVTFIILRDERIKKQPWSVSTWIIKFSNLFMHDSLIRWNYSITLIMKNNLLTNKILET